MANESKLHRNASAGSNPDGLEHILEALNDQDDNEIVGECLSRDGQPLTAWVKKQMNEDITFYDIIWPVLILAAQSSFFKTRFTMVSEGRFHPNASAC